MNIRARGIIGALKLLTLPDECRVVETDQEDGSQGGVICYRALATATVTATAATTCHQQQPVGAGNLIHIT